MAELVDAPDLKSVGYISRASSSLASGIGGAKGSCSLVRIKGANIAITIEMYIMSEQNIHAYGTVEYYREYFADIIADVGTYDEIERNRVTMANVIEGFKQAIQEWMVYHDTSARSYRELLNMFVSSGLETPEQLSQEEAELPPIPSFPSLMQ